MTLKAERRTGGIAIVGRQSPQRLRVMAFAMIALVAAADYLTGYEITFSIFYLAPILLAAWFIGKRFALLVSIVNVACWLGGDLAAGAIYSSPFVPVWNAVISLSFYFVMVGVLGRLRSLHDELEARVLERTQALTNEMTTRERLEKELLAVSEREQRRIGHDLHDSLCQHLTGVALAGQVLGEKLIAKSLPEAAEAGRVVSLIEEGIDLARSLARGLAPVEFEAEGLMAALHELATNTSERSKIDCRFDVPHPVLVNDSATAMHLFRIAQEALGNALKHGRSSHVVIGLTHSLEGIRLTVQDDGSGLPEPLPEKRGMGLHIMRHRASMIGATIDIRRLPCGTMVDCLLQGDEENDAT